MLRLQNCEVQVQDGGRMASLKEIDAAITINESAIPDVVLTGKTGPEAGQTVGLELHPKPDGIAFKLLAKSFPLEFARLGLVRVDPRAEIGGFAEIDLEGKTSPGGEHADIQGRVALSRLDLSMPSKLADRVRLTSVELPIRLHKVGSIVEIERLAPTTDFGSASLVGSLDLDHLDTTALAQGMGEIKGDVDLAKLTRLMPKTLNVREGLTLDRGTVHFEATPSMGATGRRVWTAKLATTELVGSHDGKPVAWREPLTVEATAGIDGAGSIDLRRFLAHADFVHAELIPQGEQVKGTARADLDQLAARLGQFLDLGGVALKGTMTAKLELSPRPDGMRQLVAEADFKNWQLGLAPGRTWNDPALVAKINAILKPHGTAGENYSVEGAAFSAQAGADWVWAQLAAPVRDWNDPALAADVRLAGELSRWRDRAAALTSYIDKIKLGGLGEISGRMKMIDDHVVLTDAKLNYNNFRFIGYGLTIDEPTLTINTAMRYGLKSERLELGATAIRCPTLTGTSDGVAFELGDKIRLAGTVRVEANLERVEKWYASAAAPNDLHGHFAGNVGGDGKAERLTLIIDGRVVGAKYGPIKSPFWSEQDLQISARAAMDDEMDNLTVESFALAGNGIAASGNGSLNELSKGMFLKLDGALKYDLVKLEPQYQRYLGASAHLVGVQERPFHLSGPLGTVAGAGNKSTVQMITVDAGFGWDRAEAIGAEVGSAAVVLKMRDGIAVFDPIRTTLNGGKFAAEPKVELRPDGEVVVTLKPGDGIDHAKITPKMFASALGFAAPTIAGVAQADGEVSIVFDAAEIPTGEVNKAKVAARMTLHAARVSGSPLIEDICQILQTPPQIAIVKETMIPIVVARRAGASQGLGISVPEFLDQDGRLGRVRRHDVDRRRVAHPGEVAHERHPQRRREADYDYAADHRHRGQASC